MNGISHHNSIILRQNNDTSIDKIKYRIIFLYFKIKKVISKIGK